MRERVPCDTYSDTSQLTECAWFFDAKHHACAWPFSKHKLCEMFCQRFQQAVAARLKPTVEFLDNDG